MQPDALDSATTTNQQVIAALFARAPRRIPKLYCSSMIVHMTRQVPFKEQFLRAPDLRLVLRSVSCSLLCGGSLCLFSDEKKKTEDMLLQSMGPERIDRLSSFLFLAYIIYIDKYIKSTNVATTHEASKSYPVSFDGFPAAPPPQAVLSTHVSADHRRPIWWPRRQLRSTATWFWRLGLQ